MPTHSKIIEVTKVSEKKGNVLEIFQSSKILFYYCIGIASLPVIDMTMDFNCQGNWSRFVSNLQKNRFHSQSIGIVMVDDNLPNLFNHK